MQFHTSRARRFRSLQGALLLFVAAFVSAAPTSLSQTKPRTVARPANTAPPAASQRAERNAARRRHDEQQRRRTEVLAALREAADDARRIDDLDTQSFVLARLAEATWKFDEAGGRATFARAWTVASEADRAADEQAAREANTGEQIDSDSTEARDEVILIAARCDANLADAFLGERERSAKESTTDIGAEAEEQTRRASPWGELSPQGRVRSALARTLLADGAAAQAAVIFSPLLREGINAEVVEFLIALRATDADAADELYAQMLAVAQSRLAALTPNDVLLLSAYVVSPEALVVADERGAVQWRYVSLVRNDAVGAQPGTRPAPVSEGLRRTLRDVASLALMTRATSAGSNEDAALYFALERLLPFFAREGADAAFANLSLKRDALASALDATRRARLASAAKTSAAKRRTDDPLRFSRQRLRSLPEGAEQRDQVRLRIVRTATRYRRWADARLAAAEIVDASLKRDAEVLIRVHQIAGLSDAYADNTGDDYLRARRFVEESDVPSVWRAWGFAQAARLAYDRGKIEEARELIDRAAAHAARADANADDRIAAHAFVFMAAREVDRERLPQMLAAVIRATNAHADFDGDVRLAPPTSDVTEDADEDETPIATIALDEIFYSVARQDFALALAEARNIERATPRSLAVIGVARSVAEEARAVRRGRPSENAPHVARPPAKTPKTPKTVERATSIGDSRARRVTLSA